MQKKRKHNDQILKNKNQMEKSFFGELIQNINKNNNTWKILK